MNTRIDKKSVEFTVSGGGDFPLDMLRFDRAYPVDGTSAANIERPRDELGAPLQYAGSQRTVRLRTEHATYSAPTTARWASFGWVVTEISFYRNGELEYSQP